MQLINALKQRNQMTDSKTELIKRYLMPALNLEKQNQEELFNHLCQAFRLHYTVKFQQLEMPGPHYEGRLWFAIDALVHAYHYCLIKKCKWGNRIWKKREVIVYSASLMQQQPLLDYIEVLEPGRVLSIGYPELNSLMGYFPELASQLQHIGVQNEYYYHCRNLLLHQPFKQMIRLFTAQNPVFMKVASHGMIAMHLGMSLSAYRNGLKRE